MGGMGTVIIMARPKGSKNKARNIAKETRDHQINLKCLDVLQNDPQWKWLILMFGSAAMANALKFSADMSETEKAKVNWQEIILYTLSPGYAGAKKYNIEWMSPLALALDKVNPSQTDSPWSLITTAAKTADNVSAFSAFMLVIMAMFGGEKGGIGQLMQSFVPGV
jgi:hypothetical protein